MLPTRGLARKKVLPPGLSGRYAASVKLGTPSVWAASIYVRLLHTRTSGYGNKENYAEELSVCFISARQTLLLYRYIC